MRFCWNTASLVLCIISAFAYCNGRVEKLQQSLWSESLKYYYLALYRKKCADPWCRQQCRRHVLSVQTHVQNLIFWQRDITKPNKGQSSKLLKQLRIVAWVSSGRNSGYIPFLKKDSTSPRLILHNWNFAPFDQHLSISPSHCCCC